MGLELLGREEEKGRQKGKEGGRTSVNRPIAFAGRSSTEKID